MAGAVVAPDTPKFIQALAGLVLAAIMSANMSANGEPEAEIQDQEREPAVHSMVAD